MNCRNKVFLFPQPTPNRRLTPWEEEQDKQEASIWGRAKKYFIHDIPYYYDLNPEPLVNFKLNFKDK